MSGNRMSASGARHTDDNIHRIGCAYANRWGGGPLIRDGRGHLVIDYTLRSRPVGGMPLAVKSQAARPRSTKEDVLIFVAVTLGTSFLSAALGRRLPSI
jgi:hypothetical protein